VRTAKGNKEGRPLFWENKVGGTSRLYRAQPAWLRHKVKVNAQAISFAHKIRSGGDSLKVEISK